MLWGQHAQGFQDGLNPSAVHLLKSAHPSPLSAHRGFFGNKHFELANEFFQNVGSPTIPWKDVILSYRK
jgi:uracil-DNA glycosylase